MKTDVYQKITDQIVCELEKGVRPWLQPWNADHAAGRITRPLRGNGIPYKGINVLMLWSAAMEKGYAAPIWMTSKQASELRANVRKGVHGSLVVYADKIVRAETDAATGEEAERAIPFLKGYTVFNVEQIDGLPEHYYAKPAPPIDAVKRIERAEAFSPVPERLSGMAAPWLTIMSRETSFRCRPSKASATPRATMRPSCMKPRTGPVIDHASTAILAASALAMKVTPWKSSSPNSAPPFFAPIST
jgi:N-terminal domain of anti-restriction factor ArdC